MNSGIRVGHHVYMAFYMGSGGPNTGPCACTAFLTAISALYPFTRKAAAEAIWPAPLHSSTLVRSQKRAAFLLMYQPPEEKSQYTVGVK